MKFLTFVLLVGLLSAPLRATADTESGASDNGFSEANRWPPPPWRPRPYPHPRPHPRPYPPPYAFFQCTAVDSGWEEHRGGHIAAGYHQRQAEQQALSLCQQFHGNCYITQCVRLQ